jgi:hypothetical protein
VSSFVEAITLCSLLRVPGIIPLKGFMFKIRILHLLNLTPIVALLGGISILLLGCSSSTVSQTRRLEGKEWGNRLMVAPNSNLLGNAVGVELFQRGFDVVSGEQSRALYRKHALNYGDSSPAMLSKLHGEGVELFLTVQSSGYDSYGGTPENAVVNILSTKTGATVAAVNWESNDDLWFGGSDGLVEAAKKIADQLTLAIHLAPD